MFVVLSEIDTLDYLHSHGIYPNEFYMDLNYFKEHSVHFKNAFILVIFAGVTKFRKRNVCAEINSLRNRAKNEQDMGIAGVVVISDTTLPIQNYYMYSRNMSIVNLRSSFTTLQENIDFFEALKHALGNTNKEDTVCDIKQHESIEEVRNRMLKSIKERTHTDDEAYIPKIKQFNVRKELLEMGTKQK